MRKFLSCFLLTFLLICGVTGVQAVNPVPAFAANNLETVVDDINNANSVLGDETKTKVTGISSDIQEIVLVVVIAALMIGGSITTIKFLNVGDNPAEKAKLKTTLIFIVGGIIFLASFYGMMKFGFKNLNLFTD